TPMSRRMLALAALLPLFFQPSHVWGQAVSGTILGFVKDSSGAAVANVPVVITGVETGINRTALTNAEGQFEAPSLPPGAYNVAVEMAGFKKVTLSNLQLGGDQKLRADVTLEVGPITETVQLEGEAP